MMKRILKYPILFAVLLLFVTRTNAQDGVENIGELPAVFPSFKIWDSASHNAFTDLVYYRNKFYCSFRESAAHVPKKKEDNGKIRILVSADGIKWQSFALLSLADYDLRDPDFSIMPDGRLMVLMGGSVYDKGRLLNMQNHVSFLDRQTERFSVPSPIRMDEKINSDHNWLWHLTWNKQSGYGVIYQKSENTGGRQLYLVKTTDGMNYSLVSPLDVDTFGNEAAVELLPDGTMVLAVRRDVPKGDTLNGNGMIGSSRPPYTKWNWTQTNIRFGGPALLTLPSGNMIVGTRAFKNKKARTAVFSIDKKHQCHVLFELPSGGDNSYPGMLMHEDKLYISYYSSHEGKAQIYLAVIPISEIKMVNPTKS